jgi:hypothetical protein
MHISRKQLRRSEQPPSYAEILRAGCTKKEEKHNYLEDFLIPHESAILIEPSCPITT